MNKDKTGLKACGKFLSGVSILATARPVFTKRHCAAKIFLCLQLLSSALMQSSAEQYLLKGEVSYTYGTNTVPAFTRSFELTVRDCLWAVRISVLTSNDPSPVTYFDTVYDGVSIYSYTFKDLPANSPFLNKGTAVIAKGLVPYEDGSLANYVWTALASSCVFHAATNFEIQPLWLLQRARQHTLQAEVKLMSCPPFLPAHIIYRERAGQMPAPFDTGWKGGELIATEITNYHKLCFPRVVKYEQFKPKGTARSADELEGQFHVRILVDSVDVGSVPPIVPPATVGITVVEERRIVAAPNGPKSVAYASTNSRLPAAPEPFAIDQHSRIAAANAAKGGSTTPPNTRKSIILLLFTISVGAFVFATFKWKNKHK